MGRNGSWIARSSQIISFVLLMTAFLFSSAQAQPNNPLDGKDRTSPEKGSEKNLKAYDPAQFQAAWGISPDMLINCDPNGVLLSTLNPGSKQTAHKLQAMSCKSQIDFGSEASLNTIGNNGVSGETNMLKIIPVITETRYIYVQCGKKVSVVGAPSCGCSGGNWRYINSCKGIKTVYVTIPCH